MEPPFRLLVEAPMCDGLFFASISDYPACCEWVQLFDGIVWSMEAADYIIGYFRSTGIYVAAQAHEIREID